MKLSNILLEFKVDFKVKGIGITYTSYGDFYGIYLYDKPATENTQWKEKIRFFSEAAAYIKELTGLELPRDYDSKVLNQIVSALEKKGYKASQDNSMDVD